MPHPPTEFNLPDVCVKLKVPLTGYIIAELPIDLHLLLVITIFGRELDQDLLLGMLPPTLYSQLDKVKWQ